MPTTLSKIQEISIEIDYIKQCVLCGGEGNSEDMELVVETDASSLPMHRDCFLVMALGMRRFFELNYTEPVKIGINPKSKVN